MVLVRLAYVADLPAPADLVRALAAGDGIGTAGVSPALAQDRGGRDARGPGREAPAGAPSARRTESAAAAAVSAIAAPAPLPQAPPEPTATGDLDPMPQNFAEVVVLFDKHREALLRSHLWSQVHLVAFERGRIEFRPEPGAPRDLANRLGQLLGEWTGERWIVAVSQAEGAPTLAAEEAQRDGARRSEVAAHPLVRAVLDTFPGATIAAVRDRFATPDPGADIAADEAGDDLSEDGTSAGEGEA
jgi:DNA polymerase-3 subunit gamma/tau